MTSSPQPQQHLWAAVLYLSEMYRIPSSRLFGINSTSLYLIDSIRMLLFLVWFHRVSVDGY